VPPEDCPATTETDPPEDVVKLSPPWILTDPPLSPIPAPPAKDKSPPIKPFPAATENIPPKFPPGALEDEDPADNAIELADMEELSPADILTDPAESTMLDPVFNSKDPVEDDEADPVINDILPEASAPVETKTDPPDSAFMIKLPPSDA